MAKALLQGLWLTLRHFFRKSETIAYPEVKRPVPERFRGRPVLITGPEGKPLCIACGLCARVCPSACITVVKVPEKGSKELQSYTIDLNRCAFCGFCVEACPADAMRMGHDYELAEYRKEDLIMEKETLLKQTTLGENL